MNGGLSEARLRELLEHHLGVLRAHVRGSAGSRLLRQEPLSDLVQSVALEVLADARKLRFADEGAFRRWLWRVAANKVLSKNRRWSAQRRDRARERAIDDGAEPVDDLELEPAAQAERAEELARLERALEELDDESREVLVLRRIFDVPPDAVARELGIAESTVRWRTAQALAKLAARLR